jgi:hypothetical protein
LEKRGRVMMVSRLVMHRFLLLGLLAVENVWWPAGARVTTANIAWEKNEQEERERGRLFCRYITIQRRNHQMANPGGPCASVMMMMMKFFWVPPTTTTSWPYRTVRHPFGNYQTQPNIRAVGPETMVVFHLLVSCFGTWLFYELVFIAQKTAPNCAVALS